MSERDQNISVLLRIRPRNQREIKENSALVAYPSQDQRQVNVKHSNDIVKTFTFDKVFGPNTTQEQVFNSIKGMVNEVFLGYNCTIFAYGQTGAGKTWTMEGDLAQKSADSGIIPRALFALFDQLEKDCNEYSVRVSYLELYNEELKDLLSAGAIDRKLKMFEDAARKGSIVVQGVEEILVNNADDVINILQRGSMKRQIASTKMNDTSSRSHGIFTITVHIKEATSDGEELLKVGKLHLVDLAGSENIGRSGAMHGRAKEAGMINQSLLTLGRVINALVERSPHIPYRESKLTRILQDSLGGRTKTCIIANISPARDSIEETLSTLDYAHRAKNIRNKPEVNQKLTKRALIRDYVTQIERLKSDLLATREKNGIFLSPESYNSLVSENTGNKTQIDEISKSMESKLQEMAQLQEKFTQQSDLLNDTSSKLDGALQNLDEKRSELELLLNETLELRNRLQEQEYIVRAHQTTESRLDSIANNLKSTLESSVQDIQGLHAKIERKTSLEHENMHIFEDFQSKLFAHFKSLGHVMSTYQDSYAEVMSKLGSEDKMTNEALDREHEVLVKSGHEQFERYHRELVEHESRLTNELQAMGVSHSNSIIRLGEKSESESGLIKESLRSHSTEMHQLLQDHANFLDSGLKSSLEMLSNLCNQTTSLVQSNLQSTETHSDELIKSLQSELEILRHENQILKQKHSQDQKEMNELQTGFMRDFNNLFNSYNQSVSEIQKSGYEAGVEQIDRQMVKTEQTLANSKAWKDKVSQQYRSLNDGIVQLESELAHSQRQLQSEMTEKNGAMILALDRGLKETVDGIDGLNTLNINGLKELESSNQSLIQNLDLALKNATKISKDVLEDVKARFDGLKDNAVGISNSFKFHLSVTNNIVNNLDDSNSKFSSAIDNCLENMHESLQGGLQVDKSTGKTPRKKVITLPEKWELTRPHEELIEELRTGIVEANENEGMTVLTTPSKLPQRKRKVLGESEHF